MLSLEALFFAGNFFVFFDFATALTALYFALNTA